MLSVNITINIDRTIKLHILMVSQVSYRRRVMFLVIFLFHQHSGQADTVMPANDLSSSTLETVPEQPAIEAPTRLHR